jgi:single-strand DNA-binding protein
VLNRVELIGRLGKDPETRYATSGNAVTSFTVATSESWKDKQTGEKVEKTEWHNVTAFGRLAEVCGQYLQKGALVYVSGKITTEKYEKDGQTRYSTKVIAGEMKMLGAKGESSERQRQESVSSEFGGFEDESSDIPF